MKEVSIRKSYCIVDEDRSCTFLKPMSGEYNNKIIVIIEDAYGAMDLKLATSKDLAIDYHLSFYKINEILNALEYSQVQKEIIFA